MLTAPLLQPQQMRAPAPAPVVRQLQAILSRGSVWRANGFDPQIGADCWGLCWWAYQQAGIALPCDPFEAEQHFVNVARPWQPWDIVYTQGLLAFSPRHLGLLLAPPFGYHISRDSNGLARFNAQHPFWQRCIRRTWRYRGWACA